MALFHVQTRGESVADGSGWYKRRVLSSCDRYLIARGVWRAEACAQLRATAGAGG